MKRPGAALRALRSVGVAVVLLTACSSGIPAPPPATPRVVVGLQSEPLAGALDSLHVVVTLDQATVTDATLDASALPREFVVTQANAPDGASIGVRVEGYARSTGSALLLVRTARTHFVAGDARLLRVMLQGACLLGLPGGAPGAPACAAPQTCIDGSCQDDAVGATNLEPYETAWASEAPDVCKPLNAGAPALQVGTGQTAFLPVVDGQTVQMEQGPQGGHHVWIAVRQRNLKQRGSTTTITSVQPGGGRTGPRTSVVFDFDPDEGGFCKLSGLRYQLDVDGTDYHTFLGKPLDVTVSVVDPSGATAAATAHVNVDAALLCPTGIPGCT